MRRVARPRVAASSRSRAAKLRAAPAPPHAPKRQELARPRYRGLDRDTSNRSSRHVSRGEEDTGNGVPTRQPPEFDQAREQAARPIGRSTDFAHRHLRKPATDMNTLALCAHHWPRYKTSRRSRRALRHHCRPWIAGRTRLGANSSPTNRAPTKYHRRPAVGPRPRRARASPRPPAFPALVFRRSSLRRAQIRAGAT